MMTKSLSLRTLSLSSLTWYTTVVLGASLIIWSMRRVSVQTSLHGLPAFVMIATLIAVLELLPLVQGRGHDPHGVVMSTSFTFAMLFLWGLAPTVLLVSIGSLVADLRAGKQWWKIVFNPCQYALSIGTAWLITLAVGHASALDEPLRSFRPDDLVWMAGAWVAYYIVNLSLVAAVQTYVRTFRQGAFGDFTHETMMTFSVMALSPLIVILAQGSWQLIPVLLIPLLMIYYTAALALEREHAAGHDALTGLPNRTTLKYALDTAFTAHRHDGPPFALMIIDLNDFKAVNDALGHQAGDELLTVFAARLQSLLRPGDLVARLGGDEFAVLAHDVDAFESCVIAQRLGEQAGQPVQFDDLAVEVQFSVGVALCPLHGRDAATLMRHADVAMFRAKTTQTGLELYSRELDGNESSRLGLIGDLRAALEARELELHYQPKLGSAQQVIGVEALARWKHPRRGWVSPDEFVPLAERSGLIPLLTAHVVDVALAQVAAWRRRGMHIPVAVNISPSDLVSPEFADNVVAALAQHGVPARLLLLEITERVLTDQLEESRHTLNRLREVGVAISLDDFGTGYSSLMRLSSLPVDEIKIDRAFVAGLRDDPRAHGIIRAIIVLAHSLGVPAIAEGVETEDEQRLLESMDCDGVQGWHIARPMAADAATYWLWARHTAKWTTAPGPELTQLESSVVSA